jgi:hypothetical protein
MFLAQRITVFNIYFEKIILPYRSQPVLPPSAENYLAEKQRIFGKLKEVIGNVYRRSIDSPEHLVDISRESLTRLLSAAEGLSHLQRDTLSNKVD